VQFELDLGVEHSSAKPYAALCHLFDPRAVSAPSGEDTDARASVRMNGGAADAGD
jgi:hypothetical protein